MAKVSDALNSISEKNLGYIRVVEFDEPGGTATERTLETFTNKELMDIQSKDVSAYYDIGQYSYIVAQK